MPSRPRQNEFARLNLTHTVLSKRVLLRLVEEGRVRGWDDPRMPTISGLRRRGFPAEAIRDFAAIDRRRASATASSRSASLEHAVRDVLNRTAPRRFAVLRPLKVVIEDYPEGQVEMMDALNNPEDPSAGTRQVPFSRELWIERDDFMEDPPKQFFRLAPGREVRLRYAYFVTCSEVVKDAAGEVVELRCTYDPATRGGDAPDGRRPKATLHWLSAAHAVPAEVRLYDHLFARPDPGADGRPLRRPEPALGGGAARRFVEPAAPRRRWARPSSSSGSATSALDPDSTPGRPVFNRTLTLKDTWAKVQARGSRSGRSDDLRMGICIWTQQASWPDILAGGRARGRPRLRPPLDGRPPDRSPGRARPAHPRGLVRALAAGPRALAMSSSASSSAPTRSTIPRSPRSSPPRSTT